MHGKQNDNFNAACNSCTDSCRVNNVCPFPIKWTDCITNNTNSNDAIYDGDYISIALSDDGGNPLANQVVYITIVDAKGTKNPLKVKTDGTGNGMLQLNEMASWK